MIFNTSKELALKLDQEDPLRKYRNEFYIPQFNGEDCIYFTGNSLGLQPKQTKSYIEQELNDWARYGVEGHFEVSKRPWFHYHKFSKEALAKLVGAKPLEVVSMNNLTSNLHFMMVSFYNPDKKRNKILIEKGAFPSDYYAVETQIRMHDLDPSECMVEMSPRESEETLRTADIIEKIRELNDELALVLFSGVQYYTGQYFDIKEITNAAHVVGAKAGFDLAHAAGNVVLELHDWNVDFAVWCSYKYLNSGPGGVSGIFVHEKHAHNNELKRLAGWWGYNEKTRFKMEPGFDPMPGADGWQLSNVNVLSSAAHLSSLELFDKVGMPQLREKSEKLSAHLEFLIKDINDQLNRSEIKIITPEKPSDRGCQLSLVIGSDGKKLFSYLSDKGVIADWREPNVIRIAPVPFYNSFNDNFRFYQLIKQYYNIGN